MTYEQVYNQYKYKIQIQIIFSLKTKVQHKEVIDSPPSQILKHLKNNKNFFFNALIFLGTMIFQCNVQRFDHGVFFPWFASPLKTRNADFN